MILKKRKSKAFKTIVYMYALYDVVVHNIPQLTKCVYIYSETASN